MQDAILALKPRIALEFYLIPTNLEEVVVLQKITTDRFNPTPKAGLCETPPPAF
jgi:hypothetical protein